MSFALDPDEPDDAEDRQEWTIPNIAAVTFIVLVLIATLIKASLS